MGGDATGRKLPVAGLVILLLFGAGTFMPRPTDPDLLFGLDRYRDLGAAAFVVAAAVLLALLFLPGLADRTADLLGRLQATPPALGAALTVAGSGALFWLLPNYCLSGDAGTIVLFAAEGVIYPSNAATSWLFSGTSAMLGLDPVSAIRLVSTLSGMVYAAAAIGLGRECFPAGARRLGLTAVLLTTGTVALFFGTVEVYAPLVAAVALFLLLGIRHLHGKGRGIAPAFCLGVAFVLHGAAGLLLPSLVVLAGRGRLFPLPIRRSLLLGLAFLVPVAATVLGLWFGTWEGAPPPPGPLRTGAFFGAGEEGPLLPLVHTPHEPTRRYALLDGEHAVGVINLFLLVAPVGLALLAIGRRRFREPVPAFVGMAALFLALFPVFWNVSYDLRRDWDLFSVLGVPLALLGALAFLSVRGGAADVVKVVTLGVFCLAPVTLSNHLAHRHRLDYAETLRVTLDDVVPAVVCREAAEATMRAARDLVSLGSTILERSGALSKPALEDRLDDVRTRLGTILAKEHYNDPGRLAAQVAAALRRVLDEARAANQPVPPAHVAAFLAVRQAAGKTDVGLLDAVDEALEAAGAYDPASLRIDARAIRSEARRADARWGNLLADGLVTALGSKRVRRLVAARDHWLARERELRPPGQPQATLRMEWVWQVAKDPGTAERLARHGLARDPGRARWLDLLGGVLIAQGKRAEGRAVLHQALRNEPHRLLRSRIRLANDLIANRERSEALELLSRGLRIAGYHHEAPAALIQLAWLRLERRENDIARSVLRMALRRLDRSPRTSYNNALRSEAQKLLARAAR